MRKVKFVFQELLKFVLIFLISFVWLRYFIRKLWLATLMCVIVSGLVYAVLFILSYKKQQKIGLKAKEKDDAQNMFLSLASDEKYMDFFEKLAKKKHSNVCKHKTYLVVNHQNAQNTQIQSKTLLYVDLSFSILNIARFMEIYTKIKKENTNKIVIVCQEVDKSVFAFAENFDEKILILDQFQTYQKLFKYYEFFPEITVKYKQQKKLAFRDFVAYSFNRQRTKGYLFSAIILILSGLFLRPTIYYCVVASLLVCFALFSQFNPIFNRKIEENVL